MKNENYYVIQGWMLNELNLRGHELLIYAIIYGFSQDGQSWFNGSLQYLANCTGISKITVHKILKELVKKELITKHEYIENKVKRCEYKIRGIKISLMGIKETYMGGIKETLTNNKDNINININNMFEQFWLKYPRKINKKKTKEKFTNLLLKEKIDYSLIDKGLDNYIRQIKEKGTAPEYIAHPTTWLNGARWEDDYEVKESSIYDIG